MTDILTIENDILTNLDTLDQYFDEYEKICNKIKKSINPVNRIRKRSLLKKTGIEIINLNGNLGLLGEQFREKTCHQTGDTLQKSNENIESMASKLVKIVPKYVNSKEKFPNEINYNWELWELIQDKLRAQNELTKFYNDKYSNNNEEYQIKSILAEIKKRCDGADYSIFLTRVDRLREELKWEFE